MKNGFGRVMADEPSILGLGDVSKGTLSLMHASPPASRAEVLGYRAIVALNPWGSISNQTH